MNHPEDVDDYCSIYHFPDDFICQPDSLKTSGSTSPILCMSPSPVCTPSAHPAAMGRQAQLELSELLEHRSSVPSCALTGKSTGVVEPIPIRASPPAHDRLDSPPASVAHGSDTLLSPSPAFLIESPLNSSPLQLICDSPSQDDRSVSNLPGPSAQFDACPDNAPASLSDKGKARELPPTLPPLSLPPSDFTPAIISDWPSTSGTSSYRSTCASLCTASSSHSPSSSIESTVVQVEEPPSLRKVPSRTRSLSNLSIQSNSSPSNPSMSKIRIKLGSKTPVNLARKLLSRNKGDTTEASASVPANDLSDPLGNDLLPIDQGNCLFPWQTKDIARASSPRAEIEVVPAAATEVAVIWHTDNHRSDGVARAKHRSYSSPLPKSAFDFVPQVDFEDNVVPVAVHARNLFDEMLPRELRLRVLAALISLHEADHEQLQRSGKWTVLKASSSKSRWVGRNRAMRELVKLSRVSKAWRTMVFDGQLWQDVDLRAFSTVSSSFLASLAEFSGPFIRNIDLSGHTHLSPTALVDMASALCVRTAPIMNFTYTQLTAVTLQGCTALTTQSLHSLLIRSPFLRSLNVKGLHAVTNATFDVLALCSHITSLNMSRCANIDGEGVRAFGTAVMARGARLALKELRLSGLPMIDDATLATLGKAAPHLEVLDLSYCRSLHNSALEAFVSCADDEPELGPTILLTSREAGRDPRDSRRYRRRLTALRHISLSNCILLTDTACSNLAYSVPNLEFLELAGIGQTIKDDGLVRLLATTPFIRKLDLEDAADITDAVLEALTPEEVNGSASNSKVSEPPQPGHLLEHLTVSYATNLTNDAFKALIRGCPRLRVLEADSTSVSGSVLKEFVRQVRERRINDAEFVAVDCRSVGEHAVKEVSGTTRPRKGWRSWEARRLGYLDGLDGEDLKVGQDECDETRVAVKSFYNWQTVDAVRNARERKRRANRKAQNASSEQVSEDEDAEKMPGRMRWWTPSRLSSGNNTPRDDTDRDGCLIM